MKALVTTVKKETAIQAVQISATPLYHTRPKKGTWYYPFKICDIVVGTLFVASVASVLIFLYIVSH